MLGQERVTLELERRHVRGQPDAELGGDARREIAPLGGRGEERGAILAGPEPLGRGGRRHLGIVALESRMLDDDDDVRAVAAQRLRLRRDARGAEHQGVYLTTAGGVGRLPRRRHRLERHLAELATPRLRECEHHQPSQHLRFGPEPPHQLGHRVGALAHEARARRARAEAPSPRQSRELHRARPAWSRAASSWRP